MMDFDNILDLASQNQGLGSVQQKRYSLQAGPPKKDPKSKGVNPAAVQALLKKQHCDSRKQEMEKKKQKDELLAKRVELKSDRKARAMASRTKDNFKGYNGIPVVEGPKKRVSKLDKQQDDSSDVDTFRNDLIDPLDDEDNYEYEQTDSEQEEEPEVPRPGRTTGIDMASTSNKSFSKKPSGPPKPAPPTFNFADLLKLAEKKQFEPVDLKPKVVKKDERLRTADELRELEMERKAKRLNKNRDSKVEIERDGKSQSSSSLVRKSSQQKEQKLSRSQTQKNSFEKSSLSNGSGKKPHPALTSDRGPCSSKAPVGDRERNRDKVSHSDRERLKTSISGKIPSKAPTSQVSIKQAGPRPTSAPKKSSTSSDLSFRKDTLPTHQRELSGIPGNRSSSTTGSGQQIRPTQGSSLKQGSSVRGFKSAKGEPLRTGNNSVVKSNCNSVIRSSLGGPSKPGGQSQGRLGGNVQTKSGSAPQTRPVGGSQGHPGSGGFRPPGAGPGPGRPGSGGLLQGRPAGSIGSGPGRPKCTVVSETISSKNVGGPRPGVPPRPGMQQRPGMVPRPGMQQRPGMVPRPGMQQRPGMVPRPGMQQGPGMVPRPGMQQGPGMVPRPGMQQRPGMVPRPGMQQGPGMVPRPRMQPRPGMPPRAMMSRPPGPMLPPITSAYKRKYEDEEEEYDPEMDDFIDDGGDEQEEISRHIREIFGYDRSRYRDESDYALKFMESSWKDMQKEEARSLKMAVQEDLEEEKREEEEIRKKAKRKKN